MNLIVARHEHIDEVVENLLIEKVPVSIREITVEKASKDYLALSAKLGTHFAPTLTNETLVKYLKENSICVYPLAKVKKFMDAKITEANKTVRPPNGWASSSRVLVKWGWFALRKADITGPESQTRSKLYKRRVPIEALMTAEKIADGLGSGVRFYVADAYRQRLPLAKEVDPFLAVTTVGKNSPLYVVERWDEPAFRM